MLRPISFVFFLFNLLSLITITTSTPPYIADENITVNCGTSVNSKAGDLREWVGDIGSKFAPTEDLNHKSNASRAQIQGSAEYVPYMTARLSYFQFTYVFQVNPGQKFVRLYFYPASYSDFDRSKGFFTVKAGSFTLLRNFSASILADSLKKQTLLKSFASINYYAFINGIEIVSMPTDLYYRPQGFQGEVPLYVGQASHQFYINYNMALKMVYRLNVGGGLISSVEDTGMFREWSTDRDYMLTGGFLPRNLSFIPNYSKIQNYTAPDDVYRSAMSMGRNKSKNMVSNLTWGLPIDTGFNYLVRLHFCEIEPLIKFDGERVFIIYIDYQVAEERTDVISWTDSNDTPYFKDYVVMIQKKGEDNHTLSIDLHPRTDGTLRDAILNGVEVFKLSNADGNLAGPSMVPPLLDQQQPANKSSTKKTIFIAIGSGVGFLIVLTLVCSMVLWKSKKNKRFGSYHPQPKWRCWPYPYKQKLTRTKASSLPEVRCRYFTLDELKTATNNFNEELIIGMGGFGNVYKGVIEQGVLGYQEGSTLLPGLPRTEFRLAVVVLGVFSLPKETKSPIFFFHTKPNFSSQTKPGIVFQLIKPTPLKLKPP
ncbi:receptor-like protein kinase feronia [Fagus crenata]